MSTGTRSNVSIGRRPLKARDVGQFVSVLKAMLADLKDLHIWIEKPGGIEGCFKPSPVEQFGAARRPWRH